MYAVRARMPAESQLTLAVITRRMESRRNQQAAAAHALTPATIAPTLHHHRLTQGIDCTVGALTGQLATLQRAASSIPALYYPVLKLLFRVWDSCVLELV